MGKKQETINLALAAGGLKHKSAMLIKPKDEVKNKEVVEHKKSLAPDMFEKREN
ncbi:MAG: hypothetical protein LBV53_00830 [Mycoplasmataceae bacterium]|jgi:hypothetical protein|nr:hypothetical protein [Mycoplasmataceae bacterium]